jgi:hypothetical protein
MYTDARAITITLAAADPREAVAVPVPAAGAEADAAPVAAVPAAEAEHTPAATDETAAAAAAPEMPAEETEGGKAAVAKPVRLSHHLSTLVSKFVEAKPTTHAAEKATAAKVDEEALMLDEPTPSAPLENRAAESAAVRGSSGSTDPCDAGSGVNVHLGIES